VRKKWGTAEQSCRVLQLLEPEFFGVRSLDFVPLVGYAYSTFAAQGWNDGENYHAMDRTRF
jgi:hypothetical protein